MRGDAGARDPAQAPLPRQELAKAKRNSVCVRRVVQVWGLGVWCVWLCHVTRDVQLDGRRQPPRHADNVGCIMIDVAGTCTRTHHACLSRCETVTTNPTATTHLHCTDQLHLRLFDNVGRFALENALKGYNVSMFAYGQTGTVLLRECWGCRLVNCNTLCAL